MYCMDPLYILFMLACISSSCLHFRGDLGQFRCRCRFPNRHHVSLWCVVFQMIVQQHLSQSVQTECSTSSKTRWHWAVRETLPNGGWTGFLNPVPRLAVVTGEPWLDPHASSISYSILMECIGVSLNQDNSATQSTSVDTVSFNHTIFAFYKLQTWIQLIFFNLIYKCKFQSLTLYFIEYWRYSLTLKMSNNFCYLSLLIIK